MTNLRYLVVYWNSNGWRSSDESLPIDFVSNNYPEDMAVVLNHFSELGWRLHSFAVSPGTELTTYGETYIFERAITRPDIILPVGEVA